MTWRRVELFHAISDENRNIADVWRRWHFDAKMTSKTSHWCSRRKIPMPDIIWGCHARHINCNFTLWVKCWSLDTTCWIPMHTCWLLQVLAFSRQMTSKTSHGCSRSRTPMTYRIWDCHTRIQGYLFANDIKMCTEFFLDDVPIIQNEQYIKATSLIENNH